MCVQVLGVKLLSVFRPRLPIAMYRRHTPRYVWAMLMASSSAGLWSERTRWGAAVSSPLVTMLLTISLCNVGVLPPASPAYDTVNQVKGEDRWYSSRRFLV